MAAKVAATAVKGAATAAKGAAGRGLPGRHASIGGHAGGFSDVFKHFILTQTLPAFTYYSGTPITFYDLSPTLPRSKLRDNNTHYQDGLQLLYEHARGEFAQQKWNPFQSYIGQIKRFSNQPDIQTPPTEGNEPVFYPSAAGFVSQFLRDQDRAILVQNEKYIHGLLEDEYRNDDRVRILEEMPSPNLAGYLLPPLTRNGMVYFDLDASFHHTQAGQERTNYAQHLMTNVTTIVEAVKRWPRATYFIPYSLSPGQKVPNADFLRSIITTGQQYVLNSTMYMEHEDRGVGVVIINPPDGLDCMLEKNLPALKTIMFPKAKVGMHEKISPVKVDWLTKRFVKSKHFTTSESRMTWLYSVRLAGLPEPIPEGPMDDKQWEHFINEADPVKIQKQVEDLADGTITPPPIELKTEAERRNLASYLKQKFEVEL